MRLLTANDRDPRPFDIMAELDRSFAEALVACGIPFAVETEFDAAGPTKWALFPANSGDQYLAVCHYRHPACFVVLRAPASARTAKQHVLALLEELGLDESVVQHFFEARESTR